MRLIDADELKKHIRFVFKLVDESEYNLIRDIIDSAPTIEERKVCPNCEKATPTADVVERKKGKWIMEWDCFFHREVPVCSQCLRADAYKFDVCSNCGADMREEKTDE